MNMDIMTHYRAGMFDGKADLVWLGHGWRALRLYGRKARAAIAAEDILTKADMIARADRLLNLMTGILETGNNAILGAALMTIYSALRYNLLRANTENDAAALDDFETALAILDRDMIKLSESARAK